MRHYANTLVLLTLFALAGCTTNPPYDPWQVPERTFAENVDTIAFIGPTLPDTFPGAEQIAEEFRSLISARLGSMGYSVVPPERCEEVWDRVCTDLGGIIDPLTGEPDDEKLAVARKHALAELKRKDHADALLSAEITIVDAPFASGVASWCGATQSMEAIGSLLLGGLTGYKHGTVKALCLVVAVEDMTGVDMYIDAGGVEVLSRLTVNGFEAVPEAELFSDGERVRNAVDLALGALAPES